MTRLERQQRKRRVVLHITNLERSIISHGLKRQMRELTNRLTKKTFMPEKGRINMDELKLELTRKLLVQLHEQWELGDANI